MRLRLYSLSILIKLSGVKRTFAKTELDFVKLRKNDIKKPSKTAVLNQEHSTFNVSNSTMTLIRPNKIYDNNDVILYCPGGAFLFGPTNINWKFAAILAKHCNKRVFVIDYPKAPDFTIEIIKKDIELIYRYLIDQLKVSNITLIGDSVGATLLLLMIQTLTNSKSKIISKSLVLISPLADCSLTNNGIINKAKRDIMLSPAGVLLANKMCAPDIDLKSSIISPLFGNCKLPISVHLFIAENDILAPDQELIAQKLIEDKVHVEIYRGHKMPHIWPLLPLIREAQESRNVIIELLK